MHMRVLYYYSKTAKMSLPWFFSALNRPYLTDSVSEKTNDKQLEVHVASDNERVFAPAVYSTSEALVSQLCKRSACVHARIMTVLFATKI